MRWWAPAVPQVSDQPGHPRFIAPRCTQQRRNLLLDGNPVEAAHLRGREVALVLQNPRSAFNPVRSLRQHALETLQTRGLRGAEVEQLIQTTLHEVGLHDDQRVLDSFAFQLSGGMLQRMMIALALLADSRFLLADEPTSDLM